MRDKNITDLYLQKDKGFFGNVRYDVIEQIPNNKNNKVLEIGCGKGTTLLELKKINKANFVAGMDIMDFQQDKDLDKFILIDINDIYNIPFPKEYFDVIIASDVLEHLINPWEIVKKLVPYLKIGGIFVATMPNVREIGTLYSIFFKGDFNYQDPVHVPVLDKPHLRFFCKKNTVELFTSAGLKVRNISWKLSPKRNILNKLTLGLFKNFLINPYIIVAIKK